MWAQSSLSLHLKEPVQTGSCQNGNRTESSAWRSRNKPSSASCFSRRAVCCTSSKGKWIRRVRVTMYTVVLHIIFPVYTDSWPHVVLLTDQTSNRLGDRFNFQVQFSSSGFDSTCSYAQSQGKGQSAGPEYNRKLILFYVHTSVLMHVRAVQIQWHIWSKAFLFVECGGIVLDWESSDTYTHTFKLSS